MEQQKVLFGLVGFPLGHSRSQEWFNARFALEGKTNAEYRLFPLNVIEEFPSLLRNEPDLAGLNVTIPYKEKIIPFLDELDESARSAGAVNTVRITRRDGLITTKGFNTDAPGFLKTTEGLALKGPALILGTGGGAKAVEYALSLKGIPFSFVSRKSDAHGILSYTDLTQGLIRSHLLIINATPLGMHPDTGSFPPIPYQFLTRDHFLYDLIYNPEETEFLKKGLAMNTRVMNGWQMLVSQAELSYNIFMEGG